MLGNLLLLIGAFAIAGMAGELLLRAFFADTIVLFPRYHTGADYGAFKLRVARPNLEFSHRSVDGTWDFKINAQGFRDVEDYVYDKPEGELRVIALGDSHTQGFEVRQHQTFAEVIERYLKERGVNARVLNTGISGYSTAEELAFLETEGLKYKPDAVVVGLFGNDYEDNLKAGLFRLEGKELVVAKNEHLPGVKILDVINAIPPLRWASESSYLYSFAMNSAWDTAKAMLLKKAQQQIATEYAIPTENVTDVKKELMIALLQRMHRVCKENGAKLIILDIPAVQETRQFRTSIPDDIVQDVRGASDAVLMSDEVLGPYRHLVEVHLPHGHNHISEFSHAMFGAAAGAEIMKLTATTTAAATATAAAH